MNWFFNNKSPHLTSLQQKVKTMKLRDWKLIKLDNKNKLGFEHFRNFRNWEPEHYKISETSFGTIVGPFPHSCLFFHI